MTTYTAAEAAAAQLLVAIRLFFDDQPESLPAIHSLASAAREVLERQLAAGGEQRFRDLILDANPNQTPKEIHDILTGKRNFLQHGTGPEPVEFDDLENAYLLFVAARECAMVCKGCQPLEVQAFVLWFMANEFPLSIAASENPDATEAVADEVLSAARQAFGEHLRDLPLHQRKAVWRAKLPGLREFMAEPGPAD